jgi:hypothetical protein
MVPVSRLNIHLQEGFANDTVIVRLEGREVFRDATVTTRTQIGLAEMIEIDTHSELVNVDVDVPTRSQRATFRIAPAATPWLGVSIDRTGHLTHQASAEIMGYA